MIITVTAHKGGAGKTTTAVNLAGWLAGAPSDVCVLDLDPQGHAAIALGLDPAPGAFDLLVKERAALDCAIMARDLAAGGGWTDGTIALIPGDSRSHIAESMIRIDRGGAAAVAAILRRLPADLDVAHVVIDTASAGALQESAILAADVVIVPARVEALGLDGVRMTVSAVDALRAAGVRIVVLPVAVDSRLSEHARNLEILRAEFGDLVAPAIPARVAVAEAAALGLTLAEYRSGGNGAAAVAAAYALLGQLVVGAAVVAGGA